MKIIKKIELWRKVFQGTGGGQEIARMQAEAIEAIFKGIGSPEWIAFMKNFHSNSRQLERLIGNDSQFLTDSSRWGPNLLAYIVSDPVCGGATTTGGGETGGIMGVPKEMKDFLDRGIDPATDPQEKEKLRGTLLQYYIEASEI